MTHAEQAVIAAAQRWASALAAYDAALNAVTINDATDARSLRDEFVAARDGLLAAVKDVEA